jgi:hypothetical protein
MRRILDKAYDNAQDVTMDEPTEPWKPANLLTGIEKAGERRKWKRFNEMDKWLAEKWEPVTQDEVDRKVLEAVTIIDGSQMNKYVRKRNLILMKMPEKVAKGRDAYYRRLNDASIPGVRQTLEQNAGGPREVYGEGMTDDPEVN